MKTTIKLFPNKMYGKIVCLIGVSLVTYSPLFAQNTSGSTIVLNQQTPSTTVNVVATNQVVLKPGFRAVGTNGTFDAKIGAATAIYPVIPLAEGSTVTTTPSSDQNYIRTFTPTDQTGTVGMTTVSYFDGLGRPNQAVQMGVTPNGADLVSLVEYDGVGREQYKWLPANMEGQFGKYSDPSSVKTKSQSLYSDQKPYAETVYEASPLNRVLQQFGPGEKWHDNNKSAATDYLTNDATNNAVRLYTVSGEQLSSNGTYNTGELYGTMSTDEDGNVSYQFTDKLGQVVLKRAKADGQNHDTYYVYDDFGNLRFVLSPMVNDDISGDQLANFAYQYKYDEHQRLISKKLPGADWIEMVYDQADRLILSQDGNQKAKNEWSFNKYDALGRVIITGRLTDSRAIADIRAAYADIVVKEEFGTGNYGYTSITLPTVTPEQVLTVNYYDDATRLTSQSGVSSALVYQYKEGYDKRYEGSDKGLLTGTRVKLLDGSGEICTALYYDAKGKVVQSRATNHLGGTDIDYFAYNFSGLPTKKYHAHTTTTISQTEEYAYSYDHALRPTITTHSFNGETPVVMANLTYDEQGRLKSKTLHGGIDAIQYGYNVRSWMKTIRSGQFNETLHYEDAFNNGTTNYNGNISAMEWNTTYGGNQPKAYNFSYDGLNRLRNAKYSPNELFSENIGEYDKNGNIKSLARKGYLNDLEEGGYGVGTIDQLQLEYRGNQLVKTTDGMYDDQNIYLPYGNKDFNDLRNDTIPIEYKYDKNGNQTADFNKGIAWIRYNSLNLPEKVQFSNGNTSEYLYDASGVKRRATYKTALPNVYIPFGDLSKENLASNVSTTSTTDYCGTYIYENNVLRKVLTPEGYLNRIIYSTPAIPNRPITRYDYWQYSYLEKDHLGNTRVVLSAVQKPALGRVGGVSQVTDYYPFGMEISDPTLTQPTVQGNVANDYLYNGKEMDRMHGLNMLDYGARWYDPASVRFLTIDPLTERYSFQSIYCYASNNPIRFIDINGMGPGDPEYAYWVATNPLGAIADASRQVFETIASAFSFEISTTATIQTTTTGSGSSMISGSSSVITENKATFSFTPQNMFNYTGDNNNVPIPFSASTNQTTKNEQKVSISLPVLGKAVNLSVATSQDTKGTQKTTVEAGVGLTNKSSTLAATAYGQVVNTTTSNGTKLITAKIGAKVLLPIGKTTNESTTTTTSVGIKVELEKKLISY